MIGKNLLSWTICIDLRGNTVPYVDVRSCKSLSAELDGPKLRNCTGCDEPGYGRREMHIVDIQGSHRPCNVVHSVFIARNTETT